MILSEKGRNNLFMDSVPATVPDAGNSAVNTTDRIPDPVELIFRVRVKNKQCMMVISTMEKN